MTLQEAPTNQKAADVHEGFVNLGGAFESNSEAPKSMQPGERSLDHPTVNAQAAAMSGIPLREVRAYRTSPQRPPLPLRIVTPIGVKASRAAPGPTGRPSHGRDRVHQRHQLRHIMSIGLRQANGQGEPLPIRDKVVFAPQLPSIRRIRTRFFPPPTARREELSATARSQSILSAPRRRASRTSWIFFHTPARCHAPRYCQQVCPQHPISWGNNLQGMPDWSTNRMPVRTVLRSAGFRPGYRRLRFFGGGSNGSITAQRASAISGFVMESNLPWLPLP